MSEFNMYRYQVLLGSCALLVEGNIVVKNSLVDSEEDLRTEVYRAVICQYSKEEELSLVSLIGLGEVILQDTSQRKGLNVGKYSRWHTIKD